MALMDVYNHLPVFAQNIAFSAAGARIQGTRYGAGFHRMLEEFESHEGWSRDQLCEWRDGRLRELIDHAYRTVPYYRSVMDEGGIDPASIKSADDLKRLPLLTKDMVKADPASFVSSEAKSMNVLHVHTSGTTGSGFRFDSTVECQQAQFACFWRYYRQHGLSLDTWQVQFSSRNAVPQRASKPPFWRIDKPGKRYYMSAFHESPTNLKHYHDVIAEKRFEWISGYPSLMTLLAQWMNERDLRFDFVKAVTCGAENLLEHQADAMERAFGVRPVQTYGQTENVAIFSQQPDGRILVDEDFSAVEFLPLEDAAGGGVAYRGHLPVQLRDAAHPLRHQRHRDARRYVRLAKGGFVDRREEGRLPCAAGRHKSRKIGTGLQGRSPFPRSPDLSAGGLLRCVPRRRRAVFVRRGREGCHEGVQGFGGRRRSREVRIRSGGGADALGEVAVRRVGGGA